MPELMILQGHRPGVILNFQQTHGNILSPRATLVMLEQFPVQPGHRLVDVVVIHNQGEVHAVLAE
jgi:hypothetical protein